MDRTEELEILRKELFRLRFEIATHKREYELKKELEEQANIIHKRIAALMYEIKQDEGQIGFAFTDMIDETKVEEGRKL